MADGTSAPAEVVSTAGSPITEAVSTTVAPTTTPASTEVVPVETDRDACLVGSWSLVGDQIAAIFANGPLANLPGFEVSVDGDALVVFAADHTWSYTPRFVANITVAEQTGVSEYTGSARGTWSVSPAGDELTLLQTTNDLGGTVTIFGNATPLPSVGMHDGVARLVQCSPEILEYEYDTPLGTVHQRLVFAG